MKKTIQVKIEINTSSKAAKEWEKPIMFFESEAAEILNELSSDFSFGRYKMKEKNRTTKSGSKYSIDFAPKSTNGGEKKEEGSGF